MFLAPKVGIAQSTLDDRLFAHACALDPAESVEPKPVSICPTDVHARDTGGS